MVNARVSGLASQTVVKSSTTGAKARLSTLRVDSVFTTNARGVRATGITAQTIFTTVAKGTRASQIGAQVVVKTGLAGGKMRVAYGEARVVYSIGSPFTERARAWTFDFDGHTFYALDMGVSGTLIYDQATEQWSRFDTEGFEGQWNMKNGFHWRTGKKVIAGDISSGQLWEMDEDSFLDDDFRPVQYEVRGVVFVTDDRYHENYLVRLQGSAGRLADPDLTQTVKLKMQFSDDETQSWSPEYEITLQQDERQRIEFRSLGSFTSPGRIFRFYDEGGIKFIGYCVADVEE